MERAWKMMCEKYWISPIRQRDSARIDEILAVLSVVWKAQPDFRLGQLICGPTPVGRDLFFLEDHELKMILMKQFDT